MQNSARRIDAVAALLADVDETVGRAAAVDAELGHIPDELAAVELVEQAARESERQERLALAEAEGRLAEVEHSRRRSKDVKAQAERSVLRAREAVAEAVARVARAEQRRRALREREAELRAETARLVEAAHTTATAIRDVPTVSESGREPPGVGLDGAAEWGGRAHAALFVVRGVLEAERQRIVDEASAARCGRPSRAVGRRERRAPCAGGSRQSLARRADGSVGRLRKRGIRRPQVERAAVAASGREPVVEAGDAVVGEIAIALDSHQRARRPGRRDRAAARAPRLPGGRSTPSRPRCGSRADASPRARAP